MRAPKHVRPSAKPVRHWEWLSGAMNMVDVHCVVLGGEFAPLTDLLRPGIEAQLQHRVLAAEFCEFRVRESCSGLSPATTGERSEPCGP